MNTRIKYMIGAAASLAIFGMSAGLAKADGAFDGATFGVDGVAAYGSADDLSGFGYGGGASVGYGKVLNKTYTGVELRGELSNHELDDSGASITKRQSYGGAVKVGRQVAPDAIAYGLVGYERGMFEVDGGSDVWANGIRSGLGFEKSLTGGVSVKTEGSYTRWMSDALDDSPNEFGMRLGLSYRY
jgi:hypothetical protein